VRWVVQRWRDRAREKQYGHIREAIEEGNLTGLARMLATTPPGTVLTAGWARRCSCGAWRRATSRAASCWWRAAPRSDARTSTGVTALALASQMGFRGGVEALLAAGADPNVHDLAGMTPLDVAEEHGAHDIAGVLLRYGASRTGSPRWRRQHPREYSRTMHQLGDSISFASPGRRARARPAAAAPRALKNPTHNSRSRTPPGSSGAENSILHPETPMQDQLIIFDTTLRDGEQSPGAAMTRDEKVRIGKQLERLRVDVIEAGSPPRAPATSRRSARSPRR
jgi:hypothetical protein